MGILTLPSILAMLIKLWLFKVSGKALFVQNPYLAFLLCSLLVMNGVELVSFLYVDRPEDGLLILLSYYIAAIYSICAFVLLGLKTGSPKARWPVFLILSLSTVVAILLCIPDLMVSGVRSIGYSISKVEGQYYWLLQVYLIGMLLFGTVILLKHVVKNADPLIQKRSMVLLVSTLPMVVAAVSVILLMAIGLKVNAVIILSLVTSITLAILIYTESRYRLFLFLSYIPYTREHEIKKAVDGLVRQSAEVLFKQGSALDMKSISARFETALIEMAIEATGGNKTHAAEILQIGKATLHRKLGKG